MYSLRAVIVLIALCAAVPLSNGQIDTTSIEFETFLYEDKANETLECIRNELKFLNELDLIEALGLSKTSLKLSGSFYLYNFKLEHLMDWLISALKIKLVALGLGLDITTTIKWKEFTLATAYLLDLRIMDLLPVKKNATLRAGVTDLEIGVSISVKINTVEGELPFKISEFKIDKFDIGDTIIDLGNAIEIGKGTLEDIRDILEYFLSSTYGIQSTGIIKEDFKTVLEYFVNQLTTDYTLRANIANYVFRDLQKCFNVL